MFITVEGCDFIGKTRLCQNIKTHLYRDGSTRVLYTYEPGDTDGGKDIRVVFQNNQNLLPMTELFLFMADRVEHTKKVIEPFLKHPDPIVICDRYIDSTYVYQGLAGMSEKTIDTLHSVYNFPAPDLTILLVCDKAALWNRVKKEANIRRTQSNPIARWDVFEKQMPVQDLFIKRARKYPDRIKLVENGDQNFEITVQRSLDLINNLRRESNEKEALDNPSKASRR